MFTRDGDQWRHFVGGNRPGRCRLDQTPHGAHILAEWADLTTDEVTALAATADGSDPLDWVTAQQATDILAAQQGSGQAFGAADGHTNPAPGRAARIAALGADPDRRQRTNALLAQA